MRIAIIVGSTRPGRNADVVAKWVYSHAVQRTDATFEVVDIADFKLPLLDEPFPPAMGKYTHAHTRAWATKIASFDGFVFVTPEYNHSTSGALKNAIDFLKNEWHNKAAGFVGYGAVGGTRAVEHLRLIMGELQVADVRGPKWRCRDSPIGRTSPSSRPGPQHASLLSTMLDQVVAWSRALAPLPNT